MIVTYYASSTESGCGHFCARLGPGHNLSGAIAKSALVMRYPAACILDISSVPWGAIAEEPYPCGRDYYLRHGATVMQEGGAR